jgi:hypothetical protein
VAKPRDDRPRDLLRPALDIIDLDHALARLAREIDWGFLQRVHSARGPATTADAAGGRVVHSQAHAQPFGRGAVRSLAGEPVLPVLLRRIELLPSACRSTVVVDPLAPALGRRAARGSGSGEPVGGAQDRGAGGARPRAGGGRHHGAAKSRRPTRPTRGLGHRAFEKLVELAKRNVCRCARATGAWPSGRRSWSDATPTRTSSSGRGARSNSCAPGWGG